MTRIVPWHSARDTDRKVYHDSTRCTEGNNIEQRYRRLGTDARPRCRNCEDAERVTSTSA